MKYTIVREIKKDSLYEATKKGDKKRYLARKVTSKELNQSKDYLNKEINILKQIEHDNILKFYELEKQKGNYFLFYEYCNGQRLSDVIAKYEERKHKRNLHEGIVQLIFKQLIDAVKYLHNHNIIHGNISLENIFVSFDSEESLRDLYFKSAKFKIGKFGNSKVVKGNEQWIGNELLDKKSELNSDSKAEIWSLGLLCYELLVGTKPIQANSKEEFIEQLKQGKCKIPTKLQLSKESICFINSMLQSNPDNRWDIFYLSVHQFIITPYKDLQKITVNKKDFHKELFDNDNNIIIDCNSPLSSTFWDDIFKVEDKYSEQVHSIGSLLLNKRPTVSINVIESSFKISDKDNFNETSNMIDTSNQSNNKFIVCSSVIPEENIKNVDISSDLEKMIKESFDKMNRDFAVTIHCNTIPIVPTFLPENQMYEIEGHNKQLYYKKYINLQL